MITHTGGCHCGRVRFEVQAPAKLDVLECKAGYLHLLGMRHQVLLRAGLGTEQPQRERSLPRPGTVEGMTITPYDGRNLRRRRFSL